MKKKKQEEFVETSSKIKILEKQKKGIVKIDFADLNEKEKTPKKGGIKTRTKKKKAVVELPMKNLIEEKMPKKVSPDDLPYIEPAQKLDYKPKESEIQGKDTAQIEEIIEPKEVPLTDLPYIQPKEPAKEMQGCISVEELKKGIEEMDIKELKQKIKMKKKQLKQEFKTTKKLLKQQKKEEKIKAKFEKQLKKQVEKKQIEIPQKEEISEKDNPIKQISLIPLGCQIIKVCPICNSKLKKKKLTRELNNLRQKIICKKCNYVRELNFEV